MAHPVTGQLSEREWWNLHNPEYRARCKEKLVTWHRRNRAQHRALHRSPPVATYKAARIRAVFIDPEFRRRNGFASDVKKTAIVDDVRAGRFYDDIANEHGVSRQTVRRYAREAGVPVDEQSRLLKLRRRKSCQ